MYDHWFVSRQKRQLTQILPALIAYSDICVGEKWSGNTKLQLKWEDELAKRSITEHGTLRARKAGAGGGGIRTLFKQMKDLGLVFLEDDTNRCQLTLIGESLVKGDVTFVEAMRLQLQKYQYPSAACWTGTGSVNHEFRVHPFQFMFRLLLDNRLENRLTMDEMKFIVIFHARNDSIECFEYVVQEILKSRKDTTYFENYQDPKKTYSNIANTFFNYISLTQYIDRIPQAICIRAGRENDIATFIQKDAKFIQNPELTENYLRNYGKGYTAKDLRNFDKVKSLSKSEIMNARINKEYVLLALETPITEITSDVVEKISVRTGIDEKYIEKYLVTNHSKGNIDDFFVNYKELSLAGRDGAIAFEEATCEMFKKIFHMNVKHVGQIGNTPDIYVESDDAKYCGILDNKAYKNGYSLIGDHKRRMEVEYIPHVKEYGGDKYGDKYPLKFFSYIANSFGSNIDYQIKQIRDDTGVNGSAMPVDILINLAQDYADKRLDHESIRQVFSVNHRVSLEDIEHIEKKIYPLNPSSGLLVAEKKQV